MEEKILAVLERIAVALEAPTKNFNRDDFEKKQRAMLRAVSDPRFPGLKTRAMNPELYISEDVRDAVLARGDPALVLNHIVNDKVALERLAALEPDDLETELAVIERRAAMTFAAKK